MSPSQISAAIRPSAPFSLDESKYQVVLPEDLHPLVVSVQSFESALGDLHQEEIFFVVIVKPLMMITAQVAPKSPLFAEPSVCGPVCHVMLVQSLVWKLRTCIESAQEAFAVQLVRLRLYYALCHFFSSDLMYSRYE